eukprot:COSAG02_NODE_13044_length_1455_cov_0.771386_2_plen_284_part_00
MHRIAEFGRLQRLPRLDDLPLDGGENDTSPGSAANVERPGMPCISDDADPGMDESDLWLHDRLSKHEREVQPDDEHDPSRRRRRPPPLELPPDPVRFSSPNAMAAQRVREERATAAVCSQSAPGPEADDPEVSARDVVSADQYGQALRAIAEEAEMAGTQTNFVSLEQTLEHSLATGSPPVTSSGDDIAAAIGPAARGSDPSRQDDTRDLKTAPQRQSEKQPASKLEPALDLIPDDTDQPVSAQRRNADEAPETDHRKESPVASPPTDSVKQTRSYASGTVIG